MPPNRTEPAPGPDEAPATAPAPTPPTSSGGGLKSWLPLAVTILLMPVLAYAMTSFVLIPRVKTGLGLTPAAAAEAEHKAGPPGVKKNPS